MRVADMHRRYRIRLEWREPRPTTPISQWVRYESARRVLDEIVRARPATRGGIEEGVINGHWLIEWRTKYKTPALDALLNSWRYYPFRLLCVLRGLVGLPVSYVVGPQCHPPITDTGVYDDIDRAGNN